MTVTRLTYKLTGSDAQATAEEIAYHQNKKHSKRWHCRIGKITIWFDDTIRLKKYSKEIRNNPRGNASYRRYGHVAY